jgi:hypothetical protein
MTARFAKFAFFLCCTALIFPLTASAQQGGGGGGGNNGTGGFGGLVGFNNLVGGVKIDTNGVLSPSPDAIDQRTLQQLEAGLQDVNTDIGQETKLRMISLGGLEAEITRSRNEGTPLSQEAIYMAGLQRIEFIILSPETNDIIIAGPAEGFKVNNDGVVVGDQTNTPVIRLEDFLVAMRSSDNARTGQGISVSIDPTQEGIKQLQGMFQKMKRARTPFNPRMQPAVEQAMGDQMIKLTGVPTDSRFSQILVAADYKMKRLSMGLEKAKIANFPSFMEIAQKSNVKNLTAAPRFWMECHYEPVAKDESGNVWQIRGQGVKTLTEESKFDQDGKKSQTGNQNRFAKQWADAMTERFEELSNAEPAFRELRNVMDLSVAAAIIRREGLATKVGLNMPEILGMANTSLSTPSHAIPKSVPAECSFVRISQSWLVSASGGVQLDPWNVAAKTESADLGSVGQVARTKTRDSWWWNGK